MISITLQETETQGDHPQSKNCKHCIQISSVPAQALLGAMEQELIEFVPQLVTVHCVGWNGSFLPHLLRRRCLADDVLLKGHYVVH